MALDVSAIEQRLRDAVGPNELTVETNVFGDVTLVVAAQGFDGLDEASRDDLVSFLFDDPEVETVLALTPDEAEQRGDVEGSDEPLWPEALARGSAVSAPRFPTDLDGDIDKPIVATFYSLRGGVGRSTALAYTARDLAARGRSVVVVDMDFEAPGLGALFGVEDEVAEGGGLPDLLLALERGDDVDIAEHVIRLDESLELYLLPAGKPGAEYARVVSLLAPELWTRDDDNPLWRLLDRIRRTSFAPDVVLIDARTGLSPLSAPLLFDVADLAVIGFFPHPQAETGTRALTKALLASSTKRSANGLRLTPEPRFLVSPLPSGGADIRRRYEIRAHDWVTGWLATANEHRSEANKLTSDDLCVFVSYQEGAATSDRIGVSAAERAPYKGLADWLEALLPTSSELLPEPDVRTHKRSILQSLRFSSGTAESQERFADAFVPTEPMQRALNLATPLVLGRKGTGKTAVFRRLLETEEQAVPVTSPDAFRQDAPWALGPEGFDALDADDQTDWRNIWLSLLAIAKWQRLEGGRAEAVPAELRATLRPLGDRVTQRATVDAVRQILATTDSALILSDWVSDTRHLVSQHGVLIFDGLDTGFGSTDAQRARRARAISSLMPLVLERSDLNSAIAIKVLLREDIWRDLSFQNKSHFYGRSVTLEWRDQVDYLRTVVKQALLSADFCASLTGRVTTDKPIERWSADEVLSAWGALVGERMKGGKTTFTRNWVWNRLADGNGDHGPRSLLQLFFTARDWEIREEPESPYDRSVIRPRALIESLAPVSTESLAALEEEFAELGPMFDALKSIGRTPLDASELTSVSELISLAREVGLLEVYEGPEDDVRRYRIPDLLRLGLGMTRMGQV